MLVQIISAPVDFVMKNTEKKTVSDGLTDYDLCSI